MNKQHFIQKLFEENSTFSSSRQAEMVANLLDTVSSDIYSESQRFVFELIQNADDAANDTKNVVHFEFLPNSLIVSHNGKPFNEKDIISLTGAGASTKRADPTKTGYKGIGFKSVFGKSERVTIFSDNYQFRFDKSIHKTKLPWQIIPIWTELNDLETEVQKSLLTNEFTVSTIIEIKKPDILLKDLNELLNNGQILLFLRRVSKISVSSNGKIISSIEKKVINQDISFNEVSLYRDGKEISSWITKTFEKITIPFETKEALIQDEKTPDKLKDAEYTEISFAAKIEDGKLRPLKNEESLIFTYLPTKVSDFEFPFLINGSFLTNAAREGLHEDRVWNQWLFKLTAEKILDWLEILAKGKFKFHILQLLPTKFSSGINELKKSFNNSLDKTIRDKAFIPSNNLKLKKMSEIIVDKTGLSDLNFIAPEIVIDFINQKENTNFLADSFVNTELQRIEKLRHFGVIFFDTDNLEEFFLSKIFKDNHQPSQNFALIEYFYMKAAKDETKIWNTKLKAVPFIYTKEYKLRTPQTVCFPTITFKTEYGDIVTVINNEVYLKIENNSKVKAWLELLGVKEPSDTAYLENEIIGNIENCINKDNYLSVTRYIFNQHKKNLLTELHYDQLQNLSLYTTKKELIAANQCYLSDFYEPSLKLEEVNETGNYISETYKQQEDLVSEWKTFFLKIGVSENISIIRFSTNIFINNGIESNYFTQVSYEAKQGHRYPHLIKSGNTIKLDKIRFSEFASDYKFSKIFWQQAIKTINPKKVTKYAFMAWGHYGSTEIVTNYFYWSIENSAIFPSTTKECLPASNLFINDKEISDIAGKYLPVFDYDEPLPDEWKVILPFKQELKIDDYLIILQKIAEQTEDDEVLRKYNRKKIGAIYNKLASILPNFSEDKKELICQWGKEHSLLSLSGKFELATVLKWIKIDGFSNASEKLKVIQLPENCDTKAPTFEQLISLFNVQIIDKFIPTFENLKIDNNLHDKLLNILPFLVIIVERKKFIDYTKEFERMFSIISTTEFYNATSIKLAFTYQSEIIEGASMNVFQEQNKLYYKGKWRNPITMFNLIPELTILLGVSGLNDELRLLLELQESDIFEWLTGLGYDISIVKSKIENQKARQKVEVIPSIKKQMINYTEPNYVTDYLEKFEYIESESFEPLTSPKDFDTSTISIKRKTFSTDNQIVTTKYPEIHNQDIRESVGIWGEEFVYEFLRRNKNNFSEIVWENKEGESGKPYDFRFIENGREKFIDVKGTPSNSKDVVYLSPNEWKFMFEKGEDYSIYRVYNAGQHTAKIEIVENPSLLLIQGKIFPHPITLQI